MQKSPLARRDTARTIWIVQAIMLLFELAWLTIVYVIYPPPGSFLEAMPQYLRMLGGNTRFTFAVGIAAFVIDRVLSARQPGGQSSTPGAWLIRGMVVFVLLWSLGALVVIVLAFIFSWH